MIKRTVVTVLITVCSIVAHARFAAATPATMVFWYPGEAGSTEEAQPILDDFFAYLRDKDPSLAIEGAYFNTVDEGKSYLRSKKPALGIVSYPVWVMQRNEFPQAKVILATLPKPHGRPTEHYILVGAKPLSDNGAPLFSSEPLSADFISSNLFPSIPASLKPTQTNSMFKKLKDIAQGSVAGYAILTPIESHTLKTLSLPWTKKIKTLVSSSPVPTARFLLLHTGFRKTDALTKVLVEMKSDPKGKAILEELRLLGFSMP